MSRMNQLDFKGRTAIVTGGAAGIGFAIVKRLLDSGATVRIWDRDRKTLDQAVSSLPGPVSGAVVDVTRSAGRHESGRRCHQGPR